MGKISQIQKSIAICETLPSKCLLLRELLKPPCTHHKYLEMLILEVL